MTPAYLQYTHKHGHYPDFGLLTKDELQYLALGLAGEAGETVDVIKKVIRDNDGIIPPDKLEKLKLEIGDVIWYLTRLIWFIDSTPEEIMLMNMRKLDARYDPDHLVG